VNKTQVEILEKVIESLRTTGRHEEASQLRLLLPEERTHWTYCVMYTHPGDAGSQVTGIMEIVLPCEVRTFDHIMELTQFASRKRRVLELVITDWRLLDNAPFTPEYTEYRDPDGNITVTQQADTVAPGAMMIGHIGR